MRHLPALVDDILPFQMNKLIDTPDLVDERNCSRVCLYLLRSASYIEDPEEVEKPFDTTLKLYKQQGKLTDALRVAMRMGSDERIAELLSPSLPASQAERLQMALILAKDRSAFSCDDERLNKLVGNNRLSEQFLSVARDMEAP